MNRKDYRAAMDAIPFHADFQQKTINKLTAAAQEMRKEPIKMNFKRTTRIITIAAVLVVILSITAFAAVYLLRPSDVASELNDAALSEAFKGENAVIINKSVESENCVITLAGIVSGSGLSDFSQDVDASRTYAVISLRQSDGTPYSETPESIVATPLVSGYAPRAVNAWTLGGGYVSFIKDGVAYFLFDYQSLEMFADHTVYLAVYQGSVPSNESFTMSDDGKISFTDSYEGPHAMFTLPMDESKADPAAVEQYFKEKGIDELLNPSAN